MKHIRNHIEIIHLAVIVLAMFAVAGAAAWGNGLAR